MNDPAPAACTEGVRIRGDGYTAEAGWFGPEDRPRFGWLYRPDVPAPNGVGIVIVPPFGSEDMRAHRTLRHLAEQTASAGFTSLRFDLDGCGDSFGDDSEPDRLNAWLRSVNDACDLVRSAGAKRLLLVGVRLGATLAALTAPRRHDVTGLVAFNTVVQGRAYLRELRAFSQAMALPGPPATVAWKEAGQEAGGFLINPETRDAIHDVDLTQSDAVPTGDILVLERDDLPAPVKWTEHLLALGTRVTARSISGYVRMMDHPHANQVAQAFISACLEYACRLPVHGSEGNQVIAANVLRPRIQIREGHDTIVEEVILADDRLFGIASRPPGPPSTGAVLMLNVGANRHVGANRIDVPLARRLAATGIQVLRADLSGIGDSPAHAKIDENIVYSQYAIEDVRQLIKALQARGARDITVGGMCSGAYHALRSALAGMPINALYLVNAGTFASKVSFDPDNADMFSTISHYNRSVRSVKSWRKLLTGKVVFAKIIRVTVWHVRTTAKRYWRELARALHLPLRDDLGTDLLLLSRRNTHLHFLFSKGEPGRTQLAAEAGSVVPRLCKLGRADIHLFAGVDHTFTQRWAQKMLSEKLYALLVSRSTETSET